MAGALTLFAPDCSSWGLPCRGTSMRSFINPEGFESYQFVANANCMVSRMVLCIMLILSRSSYFLVEQPAQSLLYMHKRWQYLVNRVAWVFQVFFWMQLHGAKSPKRSMFMGNLRTMGMLDKGKYVDKTGQQRFTGRAAELKASQAYPRGLGACIRDLYSEQLQGGPHGAPVISHSDGAFVIDDTPKAREANSMDPSGSVLDESSLPDIKLSNEQLLQHGEDLGGDTAAGALAGSGSFKLVFPSVQENSSAIAILPQFLAVCGRKIDSTTAVLDRVLM
ncbi:Uncharacterized protein SCF082_LOCUS49028 [Durusdinium trenchii]|uniref:Uncharacterized protein n=1 Tax=Durusdinium trenchii TaxID=1381693 RepID=A0ABP0RZ98_9DINO